VSGLVLVTGARGRAGSGGPPDGRAAVLDRSVPVRALVPTRDHRAEHLRQPGAEVAAGDLREIGDVEPGAANNRAVGTATASSFLNSDAPLAGSGRLGGQRPRNGLPLQAGCYPASPRYRSGLLAGSARRARCAGMRALWPAITGRSARRQRTSHKANTGEYSAIWLAGGGRPLVSAKPRAALKRPGEHACQRISMPTGNARYSAESDIRRCSGSSASATSSGLDVAQHQSAILIDPISDSPLISPGPYPRLGPGNDP